MQKLFLYPNKIQPKITNHTIAPYTIWDSANCIFSVKKENSDSNVAYRIRSHSRSWYM